VYAVRIAVSTCLAYFIRRFSPRESVGPFVVVLHLQSRNHNRRCWTIPRPSVSPSSARLARRTSIPIQVLEPSCSPTRRARACVHDSSPDRARRKPTAVKSPPSAVRFSLCDDPVPWSFTTSTHSLILRPLMLDAMPFYLFVSPARPLPCVRAPLVYARPRIIFARPFYAVRTHRSSSFLDNNSQASSDQAQCLIQLLPSDAVQRRCRRSVIRRSHIYLHLGRRSGAIASPYHL